MISDLPRIPYPSLLMDLIMVGPQGWQWSINTTSILASTPASAPAPASAPISALALAPPILASPALSTSISTSISKSGNFIF